MASKMDRRWPQQAAPRMQPSSTLPVASVAFLRKLQQGAPPRRAVATHAIRRKGKRERERERKRENGTSKQRGTFTPPSNRVFVGPNQLEGAWAPTPNEIQNAFQDTK